MTLQRYNFMVDRSWNVAEPVKHEAGEYVKWTDVEQMVLAHLKNLAELDKMRQSDLYRLVQQEETDQSFQAADEQIKQLHANLTATETQRQKVIKELSGEKTRARDAVMALEKVISSLKSC